jgi:hypothetical protein
MRSYIQRGPTIFTCRLEVGGDKHEWQDKRLGSDIGRLSAMLCMEQAVVFVFGWEIGIRKGCAWSASQICLMLQVCSCGLCMTFVCMPTLT